MYECVTDSNINLFQYGIERVKTLSGMINTPSAGNLRIKIFVGSAAVRTWYMSALV